VCACLLATSAAACNRDPAGREWAHVDRGSALGVCVHRNDQYGYKPTGSLSTRIRRSALTGPPEFAPP
jgi:hypothetical protein